MSIETEILELNAELRQLETFFGIFEDYAQNYLDKERLDYANGVISMISMQLAKVSKLIEIAEKLESGIRENKE